MSRNIINCLVLISVLPLFSFAVESSKDSKHADSESKSRHPVASGKVIHVPPEIQTVEQFKEFIKSNVPKGSHPLLLLSGEKWCVNCVALKPRLASNIPAGKIIFEIDTSQNDKSKNILINAIAKSKKFMKLESNNELKQTRPVFPSLWRFDGDVTDPSKPLVEEGAGLDKITAWLDNPPKHINHADWL